MKYRALVGMRRIQTNDSKTKEVREKAQEELLPTQMRFWNSAEAVPPYYDPLYDVDEEYAKILQQNNIGDSTINIDNPLDVMNYVGKKSGHIFYETIPDENKKLREYRKREYTKMCDTYRQQHKPIPPELKEEYKFDIVEPKPGPKTKLYPFCIQNPNGMFTSFNYPITTSYIDGIEDPNNSKLLNRNYGTHHDIIQLGDLDFEESYLPNVVFRNDGKMFESYPDYDPKEGDPGGNAKEIKEFLLETLDRKDYVLIVECEV